MNELGNLCTVRRQAIGDEWPVQLDKLRGLEKHAENKELLTKLQRVKHVGTHHCLAAFARKRLIRQLTNERTNSLGKGIAEWAGWSMAHPKFWLGGPPAFGPASNWPMFVSCSSAILGNSEYK